ncbi:hypothetical protein O6H91_04G010700 [Diphasiastrum complanatum]|uniref:Uncharacterized protein n=1 Tax=Diphasiastrum complanatum TaxID=34168 RepID=A0ACC2DUF5_DIPCM|nr:hypothetical protein O6H91_04G010700 [Diphasiastrum complanatum]
MKLVITTKSVEYMPFLLSLASFVNGLIWTSYAFLGRLDVFIIVPNGIGSLLGALQLVIYFIYYKKPTEKKEQRFKIHLQASIQSKAVSIGAGNF